MERTKIEYAHSTWNPVSGCLHDCEYCYARSIANRFKGCDDSPDGSTGKKVIVLPESLNATGADGQSRKAAYPYGFTPTLHEYRLDDPVKKGFGKTIFVCSMADLFGDWVPDEWIEKVFEACSKAEDHRYLFLTKNPKRYIELAEKGMLPEGDSYWYGSTITNAETKAFWSEKHHTFVSIEPILGPFVERDSDITHKVEWAILGAETGHRKNKIIPKRSWIENVVEDFCKFRKPIFMKDSMKPIWGENLITEFPWNDDK